MEKGRNKRRIKIPEEYQRHSIYAVSLITAIFVFASSQIMIGTGFILITAPGLVISLLLCFLSVLLCIFIIGRVSAGAIIAGAVLMLFSTIDYAVFMFRGSELTPFDLLAIGTALNVSDEYVFPITNGFVKAWILQALLYALLSFVIWPRVDRKRELKTISCLSLASIIVIGFISSNITSHRWGKEPSIYMGLYANFLLELGEIRVNKPAGYDSAHLETIMSEYKAGKMDEGKLPNIIAIMNESFGDLQTTGFQLETNKNVIPFIQSLDNNATKGYAYASVFGGGTSCSEFEFLTGDSMAFLPQGSIPYQQYVNADTYSMVAVLKKNGYQCEAMHPFYSDGWNRKNVYPMLGFDESFFIENFPLDERLRGFLPDKAMYKMMIKRFKKRDKSKPIFMFGVTIQNHGGYIDEDFENSITIKGHEGEFPAAEQYLSLVKESDSAFEYLLDYFSRVEEPTIIVFFGDHLPMLSEGFYKFIGGDFLREEDLNCSMKQFKVPFVIWTNYDSGNTEVKQTSLNYLSTYIYDLAGIDDPFAGLLKHISESIPVINAEGYYSISEKGFKRTKDAQGTEREVIELYKQMQYNMLFDKRNRLAAFNRQ